MNTLKSPRQRIVIVGATSAMAEHCARLWLQQQVAADLLLLGRDQERLQRVAADLAVRSPQSTVEVQIADFMDASAIGAKVQVLCADRVPDLVLIAHGSLPQQDVCQNDLGELRRALDVNGISPVLFAEAFAARMHQAGRGTLVVIGSVAGDRGRKSNYVYGAAKGLVTRYVQGLQHRFAGSGVRVVLVKPGPTATPMTAHLADEGPALAPVEDVAKAIVDGVAKGRAVIYAPGKWWLIMMVIRHLPKFVFNRLNI